MATAKRYTPETAPAASPAERRFKVGDKVLVFDSVRFSSGPIEASVLRNRGTHYVEVKTAGGRIIIVYEEQLRPAPPKPPKPADRITLDLSLEEAETLYFIHTRVGGYPLYSPRKHMDAVGSALREAGVRIQRDDLRYQTGDGRNAIYFRDYPVK